MTSLERAEVLVSVDIEASGPTPSTGSLIALGACLVDDPSTGLYIELKPLPGVPWSDDAESIHRLSRSYLDTNGLEPAVAMQRFAVWLEETGGHAQPVFVGFNATFDWMFVADWFQRFLGRNPFGNSGLDIKAYYMGRRHIERWADTRRDRVAANLRLEGAHSHHALEDAREQANLLQLIRLGE